MGIISIANSNNNDNFSALFLRPLDCCYQMWFYSTKQIFIVSGNYSRTGLIVKACLYVAKIHIHYAYYIHIHYAYYIHLHYAYYTHIHYVYYSHIHYAYYTHTLRILHTALCKRSYVNLFPIVHIVSWISP